MEHLYININKLEKNKMSNGVPDVCVDIFSQMANLLANFRASNAGSQSFTHGDGFVSESADYINNSSVGGQVNFEDQMNDYCYYLFMGLMVMFLAYQYMSNQI